MLGWNEFVKKPPLRRPHATLILSTVASAMAPSTLQPMYSFDVLVIDAGAPGSNKMPNQLGNTFSQHCDWRQALRTCQLPFTAFGSIHFHKHHARFPKTQCSQYHRFG